MFAEIDLILGFVVFEGHFLLTILTHSTKLQIITGIKIKEEYSLKANGSLIIPEIKRQKKKSTNRP